MEFKFNSKVITYFSWTTSLRVFARVLTFVKIAILARLLLPEQFGAFGIVTIVLGFLEIVVETGINTFLIQERDRIKEYISTAWLLSIIRGFIISGTIFVFSPYISQFFSSPESLPILRLAALIPLVRALINPACITFLTELKFNREFYYRSSILLVEVIVTIILAVLLKSTTSLVLGMLIAAVWEVLASYIFISLHPKLKFNLPQIKTILSRGKWVTGSGILDFLFTNTDNIVVGKLLGQSALGFYQNAYKLSTVPLVEINDVVYKTSFPLFSHLQSNRKTDLKSATLKTAFMSVSLMFFISLIFYFFASQIVLIMLGANWLSIVPTVKVLAFLGFIKGAAYSFNGLFMARKKPHLVTIIIGVSFFGLMATIIPATIKYGILGAGMSALFGAVLSLPIAIYFMLREYNSLTTTQ